MHEDRLRLGVVGGSGLQLNAGAGQYAGMEIGQRPQRADGCGGFAQVTHVGDHVQDWLGCQARTGSGADVVDAAEVR